MCLAIALTAARMGAAIANHTRVVSLLKDEEGKVRRKKLVFKARGKRVNSFFNPIRIDLRR